MFTPAMRIGAQRLLPQGAVSALKKEQLKGGGGAMDDFPVSAPTDATGPFLNQGDLWQNNPAIAPQSSTETTPVNTTMHFTNFPATQPGTFTQQQLQASGPEMPSQSLKDMLLLSSNLLQPCSPLTSIPGIPPLVLSDVFQEVCDEQPALDMEAFLQELSATESPPSQVEMSYFETAELGLQSVDYPPLTASGTDQTSAPLNTPAAYDPLSMFTVSDPARTAHNLSVVNFDSLSSMVMHHIWNVGPVPDISLFYLFRKVQNHEQADQAVTALVTDREFRTSQGMTTPYSEVTSSAVFNALNRTVGETFVVAAAEKALELGLTLSRSNVYHLMKQYSVQGKVDHVEKLFRALESTGKSWNSNCIVIMMLAYFNQGRFEDADRLRHELNGRDIKISERIESRLDKLLVGEEKWRWEDKVFFRPSRSPAPLAPPPGFGGGPLYHLSTQSFMRSTVRKQSPTGFQAQPASMPGNTYHTQTMRTYPELHHPEREYIVSGAPPVTLRDAVNEPRIHLNVLRSAGFEDLLTVLIDFVKARGPVENVCISFLFRKVETKRHVKMGMEFLRKEREARAAAGISVEYNETTCSRIFNALFRTGASEMAFECAANAPDSGLVLSGKALHELLKCFATRNDVDKVEDIWRLVKQTGKPSSRIVYSIFRTYFDNGMMERARAFHHEIQSFGIKLSASATRNIEDVLSGNKNWVRDPHANEF